MKDGTVFHFSSFNQVSENFFPLGSHYRNVVKFYRSVVVFLWFPLALIYEIPQKVFLVFISILCLFPSRNVPGRQKKRRLPK